MTRLQIERVGVTAMGLGLALAVPTLAYPGGGSGGRGCPMRGMMQGAMRGGMGHGGMQRGMMQHGAMQRDGIPRSARSNMADMQQVHTLLANHGSIERTVRKLPDGVETVTTSNDPRVAALLPEHVSAMYARMKDGRLIRGFDPLFVELFRQADKIEVNIERLKDGVRVVETAKDPYAVNLIQAHADAVDGFVRDGMAAMHRTHTVPSRPATGPR